MSAARSKMSKEDASYAPPLFAKHKILLDDLDKT
jgi:hypothetical protein